MRITSPKYIAMVFTDEAEAVVDEAAVVEEAEETTDEAVDAPVEDAPADAPADAEQEAA